MDVTPPNVWGGTGFEVAVSRDGPGATPHYCVHVNGVGSYPVAWFYSRHDAKLWARLANEHFATAPPIAPIDKLDHTM